MNLIKSSILTYQATVAESEIRAALILEAGAKGGGTYTITLHRDTSKSGQPGLPAPGAGDD